MTEPPRRRVPVAAEQSVREERRSFFRIAAILGVIVGIPLGVLGLPALLNVLFDEPTVPVNGSWSEEGLIIWVDSHEVTDSQPRTVTVTLALRATQPSTLDLEDIELELSEGDPVPFDGPPEPYELAQGFEARIELTFVLAGVDADAEPRALRLPEPKVRFALTEDDH